MTTRTFAEEIESVFQSVLGINPPEPDADLIATGLLDSLTIVGLITELEGRYATRIPLDRIDLQSIRTVRGLELLIDGVQDQAVEESQSALVLLRQGIGRPVFLSHTSWASAQSTAALAKVLQTERPIYALQAAYYQDRGSPPSDLEEMAGTYLREIRAVQPRGPYSFLGHSFGGLIAYEMARQLSDVGLEIDVLGMIDTQGDTALLGRVAGSAFRMGFPIRFVRWALDAPGARLPKLLRTLKGIVWKRPRGNRSDDVRPKEVLPGVRISKGIEAKYRPRSYPGDVVLLVAEKRDPRKCDPRKIWTRRVMGTLHTVAIPGDHEYLPKDAWAVVGDVLSPLLGAHGAPSSERVNAELGSLRSFGMSAGK